MLSTSPDRSSNHFVRIKETLDKDPNDENALALQAFYEKWEIEQMETESSDEWKVNNLEYDLRSAPWILEKARASEVYAQNIYAALCNTESMKNDVWSILKDERWSCSWRHAGGIVADMRQEGDYMNWYCSGIVRNLEDMTVAEYALLTPEQIAHAKETIRYVHEGCVTDEVRADLLKLGWVIFDELDE